jgi:predicted nucleic acid-binding protein
MVEEVILDSSILVSAFVKGDKFRPVARLVMEKIFLGEYHATTSAIVPVEVCGSISKRVGVDKAEVAKTQLMRWGDMGLITYDELSAKRRDEAVDLAIKLRMRGMDAIIVQTAKERGGALITFDNEVAGKANAVVKILTHEDFR